MLWWPASLVYFIPPAIALAVAVSVLARREPRRPPASTLRMLGMPAGWACAPSLFGQVPVLDWALLGSFDPFASITLSMIAVASGLVAVAIAVPMGVISLAASRLGEAALFQMMWAMALSSGVAMLAGYILSGAVFEHGMLGFSGVDLIALNALSGFSGASIGALIAAPAAHRARPFMAPPPGICPDCGYDASGLLRCPECGAEMPES